MSDDNKNEDSHQEAWAVFERMLSHLYHLSSEVFKALGFDPHTSHCVQPEGGPPPPQEVLACLQNLSIMILQLLQAFSRVMGGFSSSTWDKAGAVLL
ncbi:unnamed protein product [Oreochromis niloticus]|nr:unnamed protein product [Mustela putorius furo]